jgi:hypothetical protein
MLPPKTHRHPLFFPTLAAASFAMLFLPNGSSWLASTFQAGSLDAFCEEGGGVPEGKSCLFDDGSSCDLFDFQEGECQPDEAAACRISGREWDPDLDECREKEIVSETECERTEGKIWLAGHCVDETIPGEEEGAVSEKAVFHRVLTPEDSFPTERPRADLSFSPGTTILVGEEISFSASSSAGGEEASVSDDSSSSSSSSSTSLEYSWTWDASANGEPFSAWSSSSGESRSYNRPGTYTFGLRVRDDWGQQGRASAKIRVVDSWPVRGGFLCEPAEGDTRTEFVFRPPYTWDDFKTAKRDFRVQWDFDGDGEWDTDEIEPQPVSLRFFEPASFLPRMKISGKYDQEIELDGCYRDLKHKTGGRILVSSAPGDSTTANFTVSPEEGDVFTVFSFDATRSLPAGFLAQNVASSTMAFRWDFDGDGSADTDWSKDLTAEHRFRESGTFHPILEVRAGGYSTFTSREVEVEDSTHPEAAFSAFVKKDSLDERIWIFDASASSDAEDSESLEFRWDFDSDGEWEIGWSTREKVEHAFPSAGPRRVRLEVRDLDFLTDIAEEEILVYQNLPPLAILRASQVRGTIAESFTFSAAESQDAHTAVEKLRARWDFGEGFGEWLPAAAPVEKKFPAVGEKEILLEVRDREGAVAVASKKIFVEGTRAPAIEIKVLPERGFLTTRFRVEADASDAETPLGDLRYRFLFDEEISAPLAQPTANSQQLTANPFGVAAAAERIFSSAGEHRVRVEVRDAEGKIAAAEKKILVHPASAALAKAIARGAFGGKLDFEKISPDEPVTRAELAELLFSGETLALSAEKKAKLPFSDLDSSTPRLEEIVRALETGAMPGFSDRRWRPEAPVSVLGLWQATLRKFSIEPGTRVVHEFTDIPKSSSLAPLASFLVERGFVEPESSSVFGGTRAATRAEAALVWEAVAGS